MSAQAQLKSANRGLSGTIGGIVELALIAALYFVMASASLELASINPSASPIWPPTGLALGLTLIRGYRALPAVFIGAYLANLATSGAVIASSAIALGNMLEAFVGAFLMKKWADGLDAFQTPSGIAKFAAIIAALSTPTSATIGALVLAAVGSAAWSDIPAVWATWWLGNAAGAVLVTPALVLWAKDWRLHRAVSPEAIGLHAFTIIVGLLAFSPLLPSAPGRNALAFLAILPLMWAALRRGPRDTSTVALILSGFAIWGVTGGEGPFVHPTLNASLLLLVSFVASATLPSLALSAAVASRDQALAERELAVRAGGIGIWDWDLITNRMAYSDQAKAIFGFSLSAPVTYEQVRDATHPDDLPSTTAMAGRALDPKIQEKKPYEYRIVRKDGEVRWLLAHGEPIFQGDTAVRYLGTIRDITERKKSEEHLKLVIDELNHRVKNTLAVVQSLSAQTRRSASNPKEAHLRFEGRLQALARAHDILTARRWSGASLGDIIQANVALQVGQKSKRLRVTGPAIELDPRTAVALSMVLHELGTNALKYGALSNSDGRIELSWVVNTLTANHELLISWLERDGPVASPPAEKGFGLKMIERSLAAEPGGAAEFEFRPEGFACSIRVILL